MTLRTRLLAVTLMTAVALPAVASAQADPLNRFLWMLFNDSGKGDARAVDRFGGHDDDDDGWRGRNDDDDDDGRRGGRDDDDDDGWNDDDD